MMTRAYHNENLFKSVKIISKILLVAFSGHGVVKSNPLM